MDPKSSSVYIQIIAMWVCGNEKVRWVIEISRIVLLCREVSLTDVGKSLITSNLKLDNLTT